MLLRYNGSHLPTKKQGLLGALAALCLLGIVALVISLLFVFSKFGDWHLFSALAGGFVGGIVVCRLGSFINRFSS